VERYLVRLSLEDSEPSVMGGSNPSTDSRTKFKGIGHPSVHPGIRFTQASLFRNVQVSNPRCEQMRK